MTAGDDIHRLECERGTNMTRAAIELGDMAREQEGNSPRIVRFLNEEKDPRLQDKKKREMELHRTLSMLDQLLKDPEYRAAWEAINTKIDTARVEIDLALIETANLIEDMEDRAPELKDGRSVFIANDGTGRTKDGEVISLADLALLNICDDAPRWDDYVTARKRQAGLADVSDTVDAAKREVNNPKSPATRERLDELDREIETITRDVLEIPDMKIDFANAAQPIAARPALDLGAAPTLD